MSSSSGSIYTQSLQDTESRMIATIANNGVRSWGRTNDRLQAAALGQSSGIGVSDSGWWFGEGGGGESEHDRSRTENSSNRQTMASTLARPQAGIMGEWRAGVQSTPLS
jgi:hypothetical protein